ncbi:unnamed protein product [Lactuca saligna]|uniref:Uncharacterized protein n=1 Tax=Lactuca saligna TaxID=75948 RepID=A0AA35VBZ0_LACSI|nr:unnamed protein product [Lactuca saligna]
MDLFGIYGSEFERLENTFPGGSARTGYKLLGLWISNSIWRLIGSVSYPFSMASIVPWLRSRARNSNVELRNSLCAKLLCTLRLEFRRSHSLIDNNSLANWLSSPPDTTSSIFVTLPTMKPVLRFPKWIQFQKSKTQQPAILALGISVLDLSLN